MIPVAKVKGLEHKIQRRTQDAGDDSVFVLILADDETLRGRPGRPPETGRRSPGEPEGSRDVALAVPCSGTHKRRTDDKVSTSPVAVEESADRTGRGLIPSGARWSGYRNLHRRLHLSADAAPPDRPLH